MKYDSRRNNNNRKDRKRENMNAKRCPHCGCEMKAKGAVGCAGHISYKCKNKKCGRRMWIYKPLTHPPIPLAPTQRRWMSR